MKGIIANENRELIFQDFPKPKIAPQEVLIQVKATALNRADIMQKNGLYPPPKGTTQILGLEMAGEVIAVGSAVTKWHIGDRVCGLLAGGGYAAYAKLHEDLVIPVPDDWSIEMAAAIPEVFLTAFQAMVWLGRVKAGEKVLIHAGASGVGAAAIQIVRSLNAHPIVTASKGKHDFCLSLGADLAIDYKQTSFETVIQQHADLDGIDVVLDVIGGPYLSSNINVLNPDGRLILLAFMGGRKAELDLAKVLMKRIQIKGSTLRARSLSYKIELTQAFLAFALPRFADGRLKPTIDKTFDWKAVAQAHSYMEQNLNKGKIILKIT